MRRMEKTAALRARSISQLADFLRRDARGVEGGDVAKAIRGMYRKEGETGSLFVDGAKWLLNKTPGVKKLKLGQKIDDATSRYKDFVIKHDLKTGNYMADKLKNTKLKNVFVDKRQVKMNSAPNEPVVNYEVETPSLLSPVHKAKKAILPFAGAMAISDLGYKAMNKEKSGENMPGDNVKSASLINRIVEVAMDKTADDAGSVSKQGVDSDTLREFAKLAFEASEMLKQASAQINAQKVEISKLAHESGMMELALIAKTRSGRSIELADDMLDKGIIKVADYEDKIDDIMEMDDNAFGVLNQTVACIKKESSDNYGVTDLTFLERDDTIITEKPTMQESISQEARKINR